MRAPLVALFVIVAPGLGAAEPVAIATDPMPDAAWDRLGTRIGFGWLPVDGAPAVSMSLGVSIDRPVVGAWRVLGEYEYVWLGPRDTGEPMLGVASLPDSGHRVHAGLRRRIAAATYARTVQLFVDGEAGGGIGLYDRTPAGVIALPHGFAGLRTGFALVDPDRHVSWDYELVVRLHAFPGGLGAFFGLGLAWGN